MGVAVPVLRKIFQGDSGVSSCFQGGFHQALAGMVDGLVGGEIRIAGPSLQFKGRFKAG